MAPLKIDHSIIWSDSAYEEMARRYAGAKPRSFDIDTYQCETIDGDPLDPTEAFANSILNKIRRVVVNAKGVVIDQGRARAFTRHARHAVQVTSRECFWPGCGKHNRWKQKGYRVWRDERGQLHTHRPNGTEIT